VTPLETYTLRLGDDCLVLGQRLSEWAARAPSLEEDVALLNISLDLIGTARSLLSSVGDEDELAFGRDELSFSNAQLMELDNGDFGRTMVRQLLVSAYQVPLWEALSSSADPLLAGVAGKAVKEATYHLDHASTWVVRLGDGTEESHLRTQQGLDAVWPYAFELFETDPVVAGLVRQGIAADPAAVQAAWSPVVGQVLAEATLEVPSTDWRPTGGRAGRHTETFGYLLADMQHLHRSHPGATW
jgi:ring-1,2-phenylacetyl-CoA epoxidase subunit PaaC